MSEKSKFICRTLALLAVVMACLGSLACDPCRELALKICDCKPELEQQECKKDLNLANFDKSSEIAKEKKVCERALKTCGSCEQLLKGDYDNCAIYREDSLGEQGNPI